MGYLNTCGHALVIKGQIWTAVGVLKALMVNRQEGLKGNLYLKAGKKYLSLKHKKKKCAHEGAYDYTIARTSKGIYRLLLNCKGSYFEHFAHDICDTNITACYNALVELQAHDYKPSPEDIKGINLFVERFA